MLPYPDLVRRVRVRHRARSLAARDPWPDDEAAVTGLDYATVALLRLLSLQRETRRAVRWRQREAAALLARTSLETCVLGLWCLHNPDAAAMLRASEIRAASTMLTFLSAAGLIPDALIKQAVAALGEPGKLPDVRAMTQQIDAATSARLAAHMYDLAYRPASQYFTHATSSALLRHVTSKRRRTTRPTNPWFRRVPARTADACVGLLAGAIAVRMAVPADVFLRYAEGHAGRVLPPLVVTLGKGLMRKRSLVDLMHLVTEMQEETRDMRAYLDRVGTGETRTEREAQLRAMFDKLIARLGLDDMPPDAIQPIIDHVVMKALDEWDAEHASRVQQLATGSSSA
ncbi:hypothetical protein GCM10009682_35550 [Luedemannella flava]|uniref:Uncharacterized protein n=1 Tax=Luedemannella flava TaxID=349316 RepID=A0ABP4YIQ9_9ACTN